MQNNSKSIVCLMGPTASGKTDVAVALCQALPFEIISVDSAMIYRHMDIGTAKPGPDILARAPHRLIDIREPFETYSAAQFRTDALQEIEAIFRAGRIPFLVGGTSLYFKALQQGLAYLPPADLQLRAEIEAEAKQAGWHVLHQQLQAVDPLAAARIHPNDPQRLQRALEIYRGTGRTLSTWLQAAPQTPLPYSVINIIIAPMDRNRLRQKIVVRFSKMLAEGLIDEVTSLKQDPRMTVDLPSVRSVGYRQVWEYLEHKIDYQQMQERAIIATQQLAKRQLTWLRSWPDGHWFDSFDRNLYKQVYQLLSKVS